MGKQGVAKGHWEPNSCSLECCSKGTERSSGGGNCPQAAQPNTETLSEARPHHQQQRGADTVYFGHPSLGCPSPNTFLLLSPPSGHFLRPRGESPSERGHPRLQGIQDSLVKEDNLDSLPIHWACASNNCSKLPSCRSLVSLGMGARPGGQRQRARHSWLGKAGGGSFSGVPQPRRRRGSRGSRGRRT
jgi:hypothetical protein